MIIPPKRILFATDFSGRCDRPLERALRLARLWRATLILLHVLEPPHTELTDEERLARELRIADKLRSEVAETGADVQVRIASGPVPGAIARIAEEMNADLIVTGVARHDELGDFILGTTVDRLVRRSPVPVLVVKQRARSDYERILITTDFSDGSASALETAAAIFPDGALNLIHAYHVPFEAFLSREANAPALEAEIAEELDKFLGNLNVTAEARERIDINLDYGETCSVVFNFAQSMAADLAVIGTHGRSGFVAATIGSRATALLESLECDVMLVPPEPKKTEPA